MNSATADAARHWPVVGADRVADALADALAVPSSGGVILRGPAGVGKTALARRIAEIVDQRRGRVVRFTATPTSSNIPFGAFGSLLRHLGEGADRPGLRAEVERSVLAWRGDSRGVIVVDDLPLLDPGSADVLATLVRDRVVALVGTVRDGQRCAAELDGLVVEGVVTNHRVEPLDLASVTAAAEMYLGGPLEDTAASALFDACRGIPLHARELVVAGLGAGRLVEAASGWGFDGPMPVPETLLDLVSSRFASLDAAQRQAFETLALAQPLPVAAARLIAPLDLLAALEASGLIAVSDGAEGPVVGLAHPLYDEVVRSQSGRLQRQAAALRAVEAIEGLDDATDDIRLRGAWLRIDNELPIDGERAIDAARHALRLMDPVLAERLALAAPDGFERAFVLGTALTAQGRVDDADDALQRAAALADDDGQRARVISRRGNNLGNGAGRFADAIRVLEAGLGTITDERWRGFVAADLAYARLWSGEVRAAPERPDGRAVPDAVRANECLIGAVVAVMGGELRLAEKLAAEGLLLVPALVDDVPTVRELLTLSRCLALAFGGDPAGAAAVVTAEIDRSAGKGAAAPGTWVAVRAMQRLYDGDAAGAVADSWVAERHLAAVDVSGLLPMAQAVRSVAAAQLGRIDDSLAAAALVDGTWREETKVRMQLAVAEAWRMAHAGATSRAGTALAVASRDALDNNHVPFAGLAAYDAVRLGVPRAALPVLRSIADRWEGPVIGAFLRHAEALTEGDADTLLALAPTLIDLGFRMAAAEAATQAATAFRRTGRDGDADHAAFLAASIAEPLGGMRRGTGVDGARGLTPREREIAVLAAERRRSKEIGAVLGISTRTVDNHLAAVYRKLGVANRDELAAHLASS